ncbi:related to anthranilate synthase component 1 [Rhynchosporium secalis]|uniref:aminodeoxychorismate synthase n=1 Tax=Rhynchosporium secalis TaxID=38038 RepID=A0A1E1MM13_RHYSE|nr:related to anthranilate synthase component 1 [Rhynchosporium secalis]
MLIPKPLILFIDAYDSFSNNIVSLLETTLSASVRTISIDNPALSSSEALHKELRHYAAVVCGPGPGHPGNKRDVGIMRRIWQLADEEMIPVLGICLGFQSLCLEFGAEVRRLKGPQHGMIRRIAHVGEAGQVGKDSIFEGVGEINATLYQSLCVNILQDTIGNDDWQTSKWEASKQCPDLIPLAWVEHDLTVNNDSGIMDERVLVAVRHRTKPFWAVQYHPESICTNNESTKVISNWFKGAKSWSLKYRRTKINLEGPIEGRFATRESLLSQGQRMSEWLLANDHSNPEKVVCHSRSIVVPEQVSAQCIAEAILDMREDQIILESSNANDTASNVRGRYSIIGLDIQNCTRFHYRTGSGIITMIRPGNHVDQPCVQTIDASKYGGIWPYLAHYLEQRRLKNGNDQSPFWGGFMGYTTYELGLETTGVTPDMKGRQNERPDLCFAWVERSLIIDHDMRQVYIQQLAPDTEGTKASIWMDVIAAKLEATFLPMESYESHTMTFSNLPQHLNSHACLPPMQEITNHFTPSPLKLHYIDGIFTGFATVQNMQNYKPQSVARSMNNVFMSGKRIHASFKNKNTSLIHPSKTRTIPTRPFEKSTIVSSVLSINKPDYKSYESKVLSCQSSIRAGDSYELCLTDQTHITASKSPSSAWSLYTALRHRQPAPFASYIRLGSLTYLSASPERFLSFTPTTSELRPMKGTVRKSSAVNTLDQAKELLDVPKEKAENLMIVDLVRHDLHGVYGAGSVSVPRLMVVEEYKSVFQMISIIQATIPQPFPEDLRSHIRKEDMEKAETKRYTGLDILAASLPPGSMTGAPKKRSCEILQQIEQGRERSLYSGVVGYVDVGGRGDWSVNIRCAFRWEDEVGDEAGSRDGGYTTQEKRRESEGTDMRGTEIWHIGAGGAVTALSTPVGEREEMLTKLSGTLGLFQ